MKFCSVVNNIDPFIRAGLFMMFVYCMAACAPTEKPPAQDIVPTEEAWEVRVNRNLKANLDYARENKGRLSDSVYLPYIDLSNQFYNSNGHELVWSNKGTANRIADNLYTFITNARTHGLFPSDYSFSQLKNFRELMATDTLAQRDAALWTRHDLIMTNSFFKLVKDLKFGRLPKDSTTLRTDSVITDEFYLQQLEKAISYRQVNEVLHELEPKYPGYDSIKTYLSQFLETAKFVPYTYLQYPYRDSIEFYSSLHKRLLELKLVDSASLPDTASIYPAIRKFQKTKNLKVTGRPNDVVIFQLNRTDQERFKSIAINLDRYKHLPDTMPNTYVWVNIPAFMLTVMDSGSVEFQSRVIVGTPSNQTPLLKSDITNFITYPQWTVPYSIIFKEMVPQIRKDINYLAKQNLMVIDKYDSIVDPATIDWKKVSRDNFPYLIKQRQGDDNSLGVIKFNFRNKYSVYLHDTNARGLFAKSQRALSHGCVRVKEWQQMANFLVRDMQDKFPPDTLTAWITRQEKHVVSGFQRVPVYIRYYTCEGRDGKLNFFEDIYRQDRLLAEKYFADKTLD